jgi:hypothetical protein
MGEVRKIDGGRSRAHRDATGVQNSAKGGRKQLPWSGPLAFSWSIAESREGDYGFVVGGECGLAE